MSDTQSQSSNDSKVVNLSQDLNNARIHSPSEIQSTPSVKKHRKKQTSKNMKKIKWQDSSESDSQWKQMLKLSKQKQLNNMQTPFKSSQATQSICKQKTADLKTKSGSKFQNICSICLCDFKDVRGSLSCMHEFCYECIQQWCRTSSICPCCRKEIGYINKISKSKTSNCICDIEKVNVQKKQLVVQSEYDHYTCYQCGLGDDQNVLLICDGCDFYCCHVYCDLELGYMIPQGNWYCIYCASQRRNQRATSNFNNNPRSNKNNEEGASSTQQSLGTQSNKALGIAMRTRSRQPQPQTTRLNIRALRTIRRRR